MYKHLFVLFLASFLLFEEYLFINNCNCALSHISFYWCCLCIQYCVTIFHHYLKSRSNIFTSSKHLSLLVFLYHFHPHKAVSSFSIMHFPTTISAMYLHSVVWSKDITTPSYVNNWLTISPQNSSFNLLISIFSYLMMPVVSFDLYQFMCVIVI